MPTEEYFVKALCTFDIGQNDLTHSLFLNKTIAELISAIPDIVNQFTDNIRISRFRDELKWAFNRVNQLIFHYVYVLAGFQLPLVACCGYGGEHNYSEAARCEETFSVNGTNIMVGSCKDTSVRVNWDGTHFTEAPNKFVFDRVSTGAFSDPPVPSKLACHPQLRLQILLSS
ncbi:hypothetical protein CRYUN_Cryun30bG0070400 [Craigia yunnanensis]